MIMNAVDPIDLTARLIRCPSVTPLEAGALDLLSNELEALGFNCTRLPFGDNEDRVDNLFALRGIDSPHFCFAGHVDVVPPGNPSMWANPPFSGKIEDGYIWGRGASDMKGAIASFIAAVSRYLNECNDTHPGSISLLLTGDEEGPSINGTVKVLDWMHRNNHIPDASLVGEPTNPKILGDSIKIGRRGSITGYLKVKGMQGHVAYPKLADNPVPKILELLASISKESLDEGSKNFEPSNLEITSVDVGNPANNVIPQEASAIFNIRFNELHSSDSLKTWIKKRMDSTKHPYELSFNVSGESFVTPPGLLTNLMTSSIEETTGLIPIHSTSGGTSDARFIKDYCPVAEFGLVNQTIHKVDEKASIDDIEKLTTIYQKIITAYLTNE